MNGDSLAEASSRHSTVCEAKIKKNKKQEIESFVEKILIYLNCNVVKELEAKKSKFYGERPTMMMT